MLGTMFRITCSSLLAGDHLSWANLKFYLLGLALIKWSGSFYHRQAHVCLALERIIS